MVNSVNALYSAIRMEIAVKVPTPTALPDIGVTLKSGQTVYRFTGRYDGKASLPAKLLQSMERDTEKTHD